MTDQGESTFAAFLAQEQRFIGKRDGADKPGRPAQVGLALSGGGIRSATFSLGLLQALSGRGLLRRVDYLSTVSGGSYIGAFLCSLFVPQAKRGDGKAAPRGLQFDGARPLQSPVGVEAVRRLRDMGRYLTPSGTSDAIYAAAIVLRNWVAVQVVLGLLVLLVFVSVHAGDTLLGGRSDAAPAAILRYAALASLALVLSSGTAYWMTRRERVSPNVFRRIVTNVFTIGVAAASFGIPLFELYRGAGLAALSDLERFILVVGAGAVLLYVAAELMTVLGKQQIASAPIAAEDGVRTLLSKVMALAMRTFAAIVILAIADWLGRVGFDAIRQFPTLSTATLRDIAERGWPILVAVVPPVVNFVASRRLKSRVPPVDPGDVSTRRNWTPTLLVATGLLLIASWLVLWSIAARGVESWADVDTAWLALVLAGINLGVARCISFLNLSTLSIFYATRLRRAYIGASSYGTPFTSVRSDDPEDVISIRNYYDSAIAEGAPLHIVNVTVAETVAAKSTLVARDRKGKPLQLTPAGLACEGDLPGRMAVIDAGKGEALPLANWIAVSGAAVSAAIGAGTSLGTSILATLANVRLGYWWLAPHPVGDARDGVSAAPPPTPGQMWRRNVFIRLAGSVQAYLIQELQGAFHGSRRGRWYLTDGGHFENTGVYALLQRRVPFIIASDNGADPRYRMDDVVRLLVRARSDLGVAIRFLDQNELADRLGHRSSMLQWIGPYASLATPGSSSAKGGPIAALADIVYPEAHAGETPGTLLLIKPRLTWREPPEVLAYRMSPGCGAFPQQTTGDQFFDEEQWEAYRRLGELAGERLFQKNRQQV